VDIKNIAFYSFNDINGDNMQIDNIKTDNLKSDNMKGIDVLKNCNKKLKVQVRAHGREHNCKVKLISKTKATVLLDNGSEIYGLSKGQSAVIYLDKTVVAHGIVF
jgi:tRNA U34 2-thiouridine synthase MnmA/TrmU